MSNSRTLALAAVAAMSLTIGSAMAQSEVPSDPGQNAGQNYGTGVYGGQQAPRQTMTPAVQSGSSDVDSPRAGNNDQSLQYQYGTLANPG
jgi:hypothetical protein